LFIRTSEIYFFSNYYLSFENKFNYKIGKEIVWFQEISKDFIENNETSEELKDIFEFYPKLF
jgi:hypothetical protein